MNDRVRSFLAIELPVEVKDYLARLIKQLQNQGFKDLRWLEPRPIHLTLKFLGEIKPQLIETIIHKLRDCSFGTSNLNLVTDKLGVFPNLRRPRVLYVGLQGDLSKLNELKYLIDYTCNQLGFEKEIRKFTPHLTLARIGYKTSLKQLSLISGYDLSVKPISMSVDNVILMESVFTSYHFKYKRIANFQIC